MNIPTHSTLLWRARGRRRPWRSLAQFLLALLFPLIAGLPQPVKADDTDIYLNPTPPPSSEPLVMFMLDWRPNLGSTMQCAAGSECDSLRACSAIDAATGKHVVSSDKNSIYGICRGYLTDGFYKGSGTATTFLEVLRAVFRRVLDPLNGVKIGFMMSHDQINNCQGNVKSGCSNGAYVLQGFKLMSKGNDPDETYDGTSGADGEDAEKLKLFKTLDGVPPPQSPGHSFQGAELYYEFYRYLVGLPIWNGHVGYTDFVSSKTVNMHNETVVNQGSLVPWDKTVETNGNKDYLAALKDTSPCTKIYAINILFQVSSQDNDSINEQNAAELSNGWAPTKVTTSTNYTDSIRFMNSVHLQTKDELGPGTGYFVTTAELTDKNNPLFNKKDPRQIRKVISYFISTSPFYSNKTLADYATAGGTTPLNADSPEALYAALSKLFISILSVSTSFVSPAVPINNFNRAQTIDELFYSFFEADINGLPLWPGNLKKVKIKTDPTTGLYVLDINGGIQFEDVNGNPVFDPLDGRFYHSLLSYWTCKEKLPAIDVTKNEVVDADGRSVKRGGAGQKMPGFLNPSQNPGATGSCLLTTALGPPGSPGIANDPTNNYANTLKRKIFFAETGNFANLKDLSIDTSLTSTTTKTTMDMLWPYITKEWSPAPVSTSYSDAVTNNRTTEMQHAVNNFLFMRGFTGTLASNTIIEPAPGITANIATRDWWYGDPLHSEPNAINYGATGGSGAGGCPGFTAKNPDIRLLVGTNEGAFRMIRNTDECGHQTGDESWAFFPSEIMPKIDRLMLNLNSSYPVHPILTDGSPTIYSLDKDFNGTLDGTEPVYAFFGLRRGGKAVYALDISDPSKPPKLLWKAVKTKTGTKDATDAKVIELPQLGQTWSQPTLITLPFDENGTLTPDGTVAVVFGGGYDGDDDGDYKTDPTDPSATKDRGKDGTHHTTTFPTEPLTDDNEGNALFILNAKTGALIWAAVQKNPPDSVLSPLPSALPSTKVDIVPEMRDGIAARVVTTDSDGNGFTDRIYAADTGGRVWRFDINDLKTVANWKTTLFFDGGRHGPGAQTSATPSDDRRFFQRPTLVHSKDSKGVAFDGVILGSGDHENPLDKPLDGNQKPKNPTHQEWFYMLKDLATKSGSPGSTIYDKDIVDLTTAVPNTCPSTGCVGLTIPDTPNGWKISFPFPQEKTWTSALVAGGAILFGTYYPSPAVDVCSLSEGSGHYFAMGLQDSRPLFNMNTTNDGAGATLDRYGTSATPGPTTEIRLISGPNFTGGIMGPTTIKFESTTEFRTYWYKKNSN